MFSFLSRICLTIVAGAALVSRTGAQTAPEAAKRDAKLEAMIAPMIATYRSLSALHEKMSVAGEGPPGLLDNGPVALELRYQKPNRLWLAETVRTGDAKTARTLIVCDGKYVWRWRSATNTYRREKAPARLKDVPNLPDESPEMDVLFRDGDPFVHMAADGMSLSAGPPAKVGDADVDVLLLNPAHNDLSFTMTIKFMIGQKDHLFRALTVEGGGKDPTTGKQIQFRVGMTYDLVDPAPTFTAADFVFTPPAGAKLAPDTSGPSQPTAPAGAAASPRKMP